MPNEKKIGRAIGKLAMRRVFDSNILVYHLNDALPPQVEALFAQSLKENAIISVVTHPTARMVGAYGSEYRASEEIINPV